MRDATPCHCERSVAISSHSERPWRKAMPNPKSYHVYIMANTRFTTLYVGVTNDLMRRVFEHRRRTDPQSFTARYNLTRLVYFEETTDVEAAITREKQLKSWSRARKVALIDVLNPTHDDLAADWYG